jgi:cystathionine beta-lyase/cystathionine gamma-synthase
VPETLTRRLAELEGAESALVLASGRAAVACTALALLRPGDHLLAGTWLRPATRHFFQQELPALGVEVSYVDPRETRGWRRGLQRTTRALYVEAPVLESGRLIDLRPPRTVTQELGLALIVDATGASPINFRPLAHGADVVLHDATCFLEPHGEGEAGVVAGTEGLVEEVRLKMQTWGAVPHPLARLQLDRGLATLDVRVQRQNATALALAEWAERHRDVTDVLYAGLASHPDRAVLAEWFTGPGSLVHLRLDEGHDAPHVAARTATLLADTNGGRNVVTRVSAGTEHGWLRIQVGLEPADAIIAALISALTTTSLSSS